MANIQFMQVKNIMSNNPARIRSNASVDRAAELFAMSRVSVLMVVDEENKFVGVLSEGDILKAALPNITQIMDEGGSVDTAFDIFIDKGRNLSNMPIIPLVIQDPLIVKEDDHIAKATVVLIDKYIRILPVVKEGQLIGTISQADICRAVIGTL